MEHLTKGYEEFVKGKQIKKNGEKEFLKVVKKATKSKLRGSK